MSAAALQGVTSFDVLASVRDGDLKYPVMIDRAMAESLMVALKGSGFQARVPPATANAYAVPALFLEIYSVRIPGDSAEILSTLSFVDMITLPRKKLQLQAITYTTRSAIRAPLDRVGEAMFEIPWMMAKRFTRAHGCMNGKPAECGR